MKLSSYAVIISLTALIMLSSCGYRNPYVYSGPDRTIYIASWQNRTNELQLDAQIYQSLVEWYQKSGSIDVVRNKDEADLIIGGEIISIDLPSLSYGANNTTREVKLRLRIRYILKDLRSGEILFQQPNQLRVEEYVVGGDATTEAANENEALAIIIDELSQDIYLRTLASISK
ncbi:MAG: LptE family protein [Desulfocapsaceae bacterium]|nr:LptE family protein [Desulfocapsaceae bacterium]